VGDEPVRLLHEPGDRGPVGRVVEHGEHLALARGSLRSTFRLRLQLEPIGRTPMARKPASDLAATILLILPAGATVLRVDEN
jgi:hypothetical protein